MQQALDARSAGRIPMPAATSSSDSDDCVDLTRHAPDHVFGGGDASEPAIDSPQVAERGCDFSGRSAVGIKQFGDDYALHRKQSSVVSLQSSARRNCAEFG